MPKFEEDLKLFIEVSKHTIERLEFSHEKVSTKEDTLSLLAVNKALQQCLNLKKINLIEELKDASSFFGSYSNKLKIEAVRS